MKGIFWINAIDAVHGQRSMENAFDQSVWGELCRSVEMFPPAFSCLELRTRREEFAQVEVLFSTWGMPSLTTEEIREFLPSLRAVFYAAGSVQGFARPFLQEGIRVFSAASANALPVVGYTCAQILLANKGFFLACRKNRTPQVQPLRDYAGSLPGNYRVKVGILGAGAIGKRVIQHLRMTEPDIAFLVFDPFLPEEEAKALGVEKAELPRIFSECQTISNHLANHPQTVGMLDYALFSKMEPTAVFLNTGRGAQVVEADLIRALREEPLRCAVLDVTDPEPPEEGHPFYQMENVFLTPHIAGSTGDEVHRMGAYMLQACRDYLAQRENPCEVKAAMLETMA